MYSTRSVWVHKIEWKLSLRSSKALLTQDSLLNVSLPSFFALGIPPVTVAEFTLAQNGQDNYDVSNVDGSNLPMTITASGCPTASCPVG